ncbi:unnamed protein product [Ambrosiozyma monospora]|uniref:Unnamed protein product n=1 Tax=Ambrosiozyma monospora TaxID=43982 RepID=A0ACB5UAT8_AMBMO|nr:unnamed protein product [Ambrosiozyma monospora]
MLLLEVCVCYLLLSGDQRLLVEVIEKIDEVFSPPEDFKVQQLVRVNAYKLLLLHSSDEMNASYLAKTIDSLFNLAQKNRESLVRFGSTILQPLQMLVLTKGTWCQSALANNQKYWSLMRTLASTPKNTDTVYQFISNLFSTYPTLVTHQNYMEVGIIG